MSELHGSIGPTRNYENLTNLPSINGVKVVGNLTPSDLGLADDASVEEIRSALENKVDKVTGKGLSENDYTDGEKAKLEGIEAGAEKNVQSDWDASDGSDAFIKNKPSVLETVTIRGTATTKSGTNTDLDVYKTAEVDSAIDTLDNKIDTNVADLDERKAEIDGYYETFTSGQTNQLIATEAVTDTEPYNYRKTGGPNDVGDRVYDTLVGGSVVWNQLANPSTKTTGGLDITVTNGHCVISGTASDNGYVSICNVTATASHVYLVAFENLVEDATGQHLVLLGNYTNIFDPTSTGRKSTIVKNSTYSAYRFGISRVDGTAYSKEVTPQVIDLTAALGSTIADYVYSLETATAGAGVAWFRKYFPKEYHAYCEPHFEHVQVSAKNTVGFNQWDEEWESGYFDLNTGQPVANTSISRSKNFIDALPNTVYYYHNGNEKNHTLLYYDSEKNYISHTLAGATSHEFTTPANTRYMKFGFVGTTYNHDICINLHGDRDGEYEPYKKRTYPLEALTLRGIPKLDSANRLYFDGDIYEHDGTVTRRYGIRAYQSGDESLADAITDGTNTVYKLTTPTTETAEPFQSPMVVDPLGTEEFVDYGVEQGDRDVAIPVGHNSEYPADLRGTLQRLPSPTGTNGDYIVTEVDGKLYLKPYVPAVGLTAPTTEGEGE